MTIYILIGRINYDLDNILSAHRTREDAEKAKLWEIDNNKEENEYYYDCFEIKETELK